MAIETIDFLDHIKKNPKMYLGKEKALPDELSTIIANDAIVLGASLILIKVLSPWFIVAADLDWLSVGHDKDIQDVFRRMLPLIGAGQNAFRREPILMAFANNIVVADEKKDFVVIKGNSEGIEIDEIIKEFGSIKTIKRILAFSI